MHSQQINDQLVSFISVSHKTLGTRNGRGLQKDEYQAGGSQERVR
jgi:hypothetical protein